MSDDDLDKTADDHLVSDTDNGLKPEDPTEQPPQDAAWVPDHIREAATAALPLGHPSMIGTAVHHAVESFQSRRERRAAEADEARR
jgi:hypothetical protein